MHYCLFAVKKIKALVTGLRAEHRGNSRDRASGESHERQELGEVLFPLRCVRRYPLEYRAEGVVHLAGRVQPVVHQDGSQLLGGERLELLTVFPDLCQAVERKTASTERCNYVEGTSYLTCINTAPKLPRNRRLSPLQARAGCSQVNHAMIFLLVLFATFPAEYYRHLS